jgi:hypothetical protein
MTKKLRQLVKITALHHVPGRKGVTQIMEPEVVNLRLPSKSSNGDGDDGIR